MSWNPGGWGPSSWSPPGWSPTVPDGLNASIAVTFTDSFVLGATVPPSDVPTFPADIFPDTQQLGPISAQKVFGSPFNSAMQVVNYPGGERWSLTMQFSALTVRDRARMMGFCSRLRGSRNTFLAVNHTAAQRGGLQGAPLVAVESVSGSILTIVTPGNTNISSWARAGDFVSVNSELKMVLDDVGTDGSDVASLNIWPPIRTTPDSGANVYVSSVVGAFRLTTPPAFTTAGPGFRTDIALQATEYISSSHVANL